MPRRTEDMLREVWNDWLADEDYGLAGAVHKDAVVNLGGQPPETAAQVNPAPDLEGSGPVATHHEAPHAPPAESKAHQHHEPKQSKGHHEAPAERGRNSSKKPRKPSGYSLPPPTPPVIPQRNKASLSRERKVVGAMAMDPLGLKHMMKAIQSHMAGRKTPSVKPKSRAPSEQPTAAPANGVGLDHLKAEFLKTHSNMRGFNSWAKKQTTK